jgi:MYXO-CTERM domain-containing protein
MIARLSLATALVSVASSAAAAPGDVVRTLSSPVQAPHYATYPLSVAWDGRHLFLTNILQGSDPNSPNAFFELTHDTGEVVRRIDYADFTGGLTLKQITWDGTSLWAVGPPLINTDLTRSQERARIFLGSTPTYEEGYLTAQLSSRGLYWDFSCGAMWDLGGQAGPIMDQPTTEIHLRNTSGTSLYQISTLASHDGWYSLASDGCALWSIDLPAAQLVRIDPASGAELERLPAPATNSIGLTFDGTHLVVSDYVTDALYWVEIGPAALSTGSCSPGLQQQPCRATGIATVGEFPVSIDAGVDAPPAAEPDAGTATSGGSGGCRSSSGDASGFIGLGLLLALGLSRRRTRTQS